MNTIYAYSTDTYIKNGWYKVGQTKLDANVRVEQQDGTSSPEKLDLLKTWSVPSTIKDTNVHLELERMGFNPTRIDKKREWYKLYDVNDVSVAINSLVHKVARPNSYAPRPEQQECVDTAVKYFRKGGKEFLINAKMRFGKTFASYLIAKNLDCENILVLTYKPAVEDGWRVDLRDHVYFDGWNYTSGNGFEISRKAKVNVIFASFQDLNDFNKPKWRGITKHHFDLVIIDEMHYGSDTERAKLTLSNLNADRTLFVSGTPLDAIISGRFTEDNTFTWSYADEQRKRRAEKETRWKTEVYRWLPEMEIHTFEVCDDAKRAISAYSDDEQFTMTKMFGSDDGITFNDEATVNLWLDQVFGINVHKRKSPIRTFTAHHALWVMPPNVKSVNALCNLLEKRQEGYHIINVAGDNISDLSKVKRMIAHYPKTITVTCGRFNTGVTVPEWDVVYMLGDGKAPETYFQTIFRAQAMDKTRGKEKCFVFDFNPERVLELVYQYAELTVKKTQSINGGVREFLEFCPIIDHSDNILRMITTEEIVNMISEAGNYIDKFASNYLFNRNEAMNFMELLDLHGGVKNAKTEKIVSENDLDKGKNYKDILKSGVRSSRIKALEEIILEKAKIVTKHLPEYVIFVDNVKTINELLKTDTDDFEEHFGIELDLFKRMVESKFVNVDRVNRLLSGLGIDNENHVLRSIEYARDGMYAMPELTEDIINAI